MLEKVTTQRHIPALDGIRGLAILMVMWAHFMFSNTAGKGFLVSVVGSIVDNGWIGVNIFFVLSGFLITGILFDTSEDPRFFRNFYGRRILRIFPLYYGFLLLVISVTLLLGYRWSSQLFYVLTYTQSFERTLHFYISNPPIINTSLFWTLSIEEQFYLFWPVTIYLLKTKRRICCAAICGIFFTLGTRMVVSHLGWPDRFEYVLYSWLPCNLDGLFCGSLLAILMRSRFRDVVMSWARPGAIVFFVLLILLQIIYGGLHWHDHRLLAIWLPLMLSVGFACMLAWTLAPQSVLSKGFSTSWLRFFGRYSYGLYIFHFSISGPLNPLRPKLALLLNNKGGAVFGIALLAFALSILSSLISYHYFELPFLKLKDRLYAKSSVPRLS